MSKQRFVGQGDLMMRPEAVGLTYPRAPRDDQMRGSVAVIRVCGPLEHHGGRWFDSYESILGRVEGALQHEDVTCIILDIDSPGGEVSGLQETVRSIRKMRAEYDKPIVAYANDEAYSAAYALACSADEIYLPEGGGVGSIGVIAELQNMQGAAEKAGIAIEVIRSGTRKAEGHPFLPITDATRAHVQARVDDLAKQFFALVADVRPVSRADLQALQGQCVYGKRAVKAGLADGILSFDDLIAAHSESQFDNSASSDVSFKPTDQSDEDGPMSFAALQKKVADAAKALESAKTPAARKKAMAAYAAAAEALADARVKAKVKKTYNKKTTEEETEEDDGEEDDEDDDDDDDDDDDSSGDASAADSEDDEESAEEEDSKRSKKSKRAMSLAAFVKSLTGQSDVGTAQQVLSSMHEQAQQNAVNAAEIAKLKEAALASDRKAIITSMVSAGQLKPAQLSWAETQSIKSLKAYAKATPAMFAPRQPSLHGSSGSVDAPDSDGLTATERDIIKKTGISADVYKAQRAAEHGAPLPKVN